MSLTVVNIASKSNSTKVVSKAQKIQQIQTAISLAKKNVYLA
jgi:hypothetical protein